MKKTILFFLTIIFAFTSPLCNSFTLRDHFEDENSIDKLYVTGSNKIKIEEFGNASLLLPEEFVFTGDDIISYDSITKEIVFTESVINKLNNNYRILNIYLDDKPLLENIAIIKPTMSWLGNDLVLYSTIDFKYYLLFLYNNSIHAGMSEEEKEKIIEGRRIQYESRQEPLEIFIKYLADNGKVTGYTSKEEIKATPPIQIRSEGKTIHINNQTGKNAVITVYRIDGVKVAEQTMKSQITTIEMPVKGLYLVSIKTENKKPVTEKVIVR